MTSPKIVSTTGQLNLSIDNKYTPSLPKAIADGFDEETADEAFMHRMTISGIFGVKKLNMNQVNNVLFTIICGIVKNKFGFKFYRQGKLTPRGRRNKCLYNKRSQVKRKGCDSKSPYSHGSCEYDDCMELSKTWAADPTNTKKWSALFSRKANTNTKQFIDHFHEKHYHVIVAARKEVEWHIENNENYIIRLTYNNGSKSGKNKRTLRIRADYDLQGNEPSTSSSISQSLFKNTSEVSSKEQSPAAILAKQIKTQWTRAQVKLTINGKPATSGFVSKCPLHHTIPDTMCALKHDGTAGIHKAVLH